MGTFDNLTMLRFTTAHKTGGGIESYLDDLDNTLLAKHRLRIIRVRLEQHDEPWSPEELPVGKGTLVDVAYPEFPALSDFPAKSASLHLLRSFRRCLSKAIVGSRLMSIALAIPFVVKLLDRRNTNQESALLKDFEDRMNRLIESYDVDFVVLHTIGNDFASIVSSIVRSRHLPFVFVNHYSNELFRNYSVRRQLHGAAAIVGVTSFKLPHYIRRRFQNVADGIDTDFFRPGLASKNAKKNAEPILLYPARITPAKGQLDLVKILHRLRLNGLRADLFLAGRADFDEYRTKIENVAEKLEVLDAIHFLGELTRAELLLWYSKASLLVFPTYHAEGLPRILLESQAMGVPAVAYKSGGTPAAITNGCTGYLIKRGDTRGFYRAAKKILSHPDLYHQMSSKCIDNAQKHYSLEALASRHETVYSIVYQAKTTAFRGKNMFRKNADTVHEDGE
jgi:glycosyltransferase involved in cell wall biosynthesis